MNDHPISRFEALNAVPPEELQEAFRKVLIKNGVSEDQLDMVVERALKFGEKDYTAEATKAILAADELLHYNEAFKDWIGSPLVGTAMLDVVNMFIDGPSEVIMIKESDFISCVQHAAALAIVLWEDQPLGVEKGLEGSKSRITSYDLDDTAVPGVD